MPCQVWGTFSVADHHRERPFVADIILYDRLVIPVPPRGDSEEESQARKYWYDKPWNADRLERCVDAIKKVDVDLVWEVPWMPNSDVFKSHYKAAGRVAADTNAMAETRKVDPNRPAFHVTRVILEERARDPENWRDLPANVWVESMAAYPSHAAFTRDVDVQISDGKLTPEATRLAGVFGWEFVVPEDARMGDLELLEKAAELARDPEFSEKRRNFHDWRRKALAEGITDRVALEEMRTLVDEYGNAIQRSGIKTKVLNAFAVAGFGLGVVGSLGFVPAGMGVGGAFVALGAFAMDKWVPGGEPTQEQCAAAMFHDARKQFGWR